MFCNKTSLDMPGKKKTWFFNTFCALRKGERKPSEGLAWNSIDVSGFCVSQQLHLLLLAENGLEERFNIFHQDQIIPTQLGPVWVGK